jgi:hypothetical protein
MDSHQQHARTSRSVNTHIRVPPRTRLNSHPQPPFARAGSPKTCCTRSPACSTTHLARMARSTIAHRLSSKLSDSETAAASLPACRATPHFDLNIGMIGVDLCVASSIYSSPLTSDCFPPSSCACLHVPALVLALVRTPNRMSQYICSAITNKHRTHRTYRQY